MERVTKLLLFLVTAFLVVFGSDVEGARTIRNNEKFDQPQTFGSFPTPGFSGSFPIPGFSGSLPTPGFSGSFPAPGFSGSFPAPDFSGSFPRPGSGSTPPSFGFGPPGSGSVCAFFPGTAGCAPSGPTVSGGPVGGASP